MTRPNFCETTTILKTLAMDFTRYALYYAPPADHPLSIFAASWFGWDAAAACAVPLETPDGLTAQKQQEAVQTPKRYGFHGTLKPPFHLADGRSYDNLDQALDGVAAKLAPVDMGGFALKRLGGFLALSPINPPPGLGALAETLVEAFDDFRKAPSAEELAKRRAKGLTPRQDELLDRWGYPYVFDEFRFHLTLTGNLDAAQLDRVAKALDPVLTDMLSTPLTVGDIALFGDPGGGQCFQLIKRFPLLGDR